MSNLKQSLYRHNESGMLELTINKKDRTKWTLLVADVEDLLSVSLHIAEDGCLPDRDLMVNCIHLKPNDEEFENLRKFNIREMIRKLDVKKKETSKG